MEVIMEENKEMIEENLTEIESDTDANMDPDTDNDDMNVYCVNDPDSYYPATYVVYGMAAGLAAGIVAMTLFDSKLLLCAGVFIGTLIGYFIKKGDPHEL